jgi:hypothetical protein
MKTRGANVADTQHRRADADADDDFRYITQNHADGTLAEANCLVIDPNRRDLLFYIHEDDAQDDRLQGRFTFNTLTTEGGRRFSKGLLSFHKERNPQVQEAETHLS